MKLKFLLISALLSGLFLSLATPPKAYAASRCTIWSGSVYNAGDTIQYTATIDNSNLGQTYRLAAVNQTNFVSTQIGPDIPVFIETFWDQYTLPALTTGIYNIVFEKIDGSDQSICEGGTGVSITGPPPTNILNIESNVPGAEIIGNQPGTTNTTPYGLTWLTDIIVDLTAKSPHPGGGTFLNWSDCATGPANVCHAVVTGGATWTVTANYTGAPPPTPGPTPPPTPGPTPPPTPGPPLPPIGDTISLPTSPTAPTFATSTGLPGLIITAFLPAIIGILAFIAVYYMVLASIRLIISKGDPEKVAEARSRLVYAVVGFIVLLLSFALLQIIDSIFLKSKTF